MAAAPSKSPLALGELPHKHYEYETTLASWLSRDRPQPLSLDDPIKILVASFNKNRSATPPIRICPFYDTYKSIPCETHPRPPNPIAINAGSVDSDDEPIESFLPADSRYQSQVTHV